MSGLLEEMREHASEEYPNEACGLVVRVGSRFRAWRAKNLSPQPRHHVVIDPEAWVEAGDVGEVVGTYHSHPDGSAEPGMTDLQFCEATGMTMFIVGCPSSDFRAVEPTGYKAPYEGRPYLYKVYDCLTLVQEWLDREMGIKVEAVPHEYEWWLRGEDLIMKNYAAAGFVNVDGELKRGDVLVITVGNSPCHLGVYLGNNLFLHQPRSTASVVTVYGAHWRSMTHAVLRYQNG